MPIIDFHTHAFPDTLAPRAVAQLTINAAASGYTPRTDGTVGGLLASMDAAGIDRSVICNIATNPRQATKVNDFAISTANRYSRLIPLGSLHPELSETEMDKELDRLQNAGIVGIKLHPDYVGMDLDSPAFTPILARCSARKMLVVAHAGFDPVSPDHMHCTPDRIRRVIDDHPNLHLVVAHTGGFDCEREVLDQLCGTKVYLDTSLAALRRTASTMQGALCVEILHTHDPSRILFATDTPWSDPSAEIAFVRSAGLSAGDTDAILGGNAERLLASCMHK